MSKYYELLDTFILLLKGKPSSFLQTFHHSGSILGLWTMCITRIPGMWIFTFLNSFIHTLMYYYFTLTCLGYRPTWKRHLTTMQITQFLVGNVFGFAYIFIPNCYNWDRNFRENILQNRIFGNYRASIIFTFAFNFVFVGALILLFRDFARRTYGQNKKEVASTTTLKSKKTKEVKETETVHVADDSAIASASPSKAKKGRKTSSVQVATSVLIEAEAKPEPQLEVEVVKPKKTVKTIKASNSIKSKSTTASSRSKSRARSIVRSKSQSRASSPSKSTSAPATSRRSRRN